MRRPKRFVQLSSLIPKARPIPIGCDKYHAAVQADDREALLSRVMLAPVPRYLITEPGMGYRFIGKEQ